MDFTLSKKHEMARSLFREFAEKEVKPLAQEVDETETFPRETGEKMSSLTIYQDDCFKTTAACCLAFTKHITEFDIVSLDFLFKVIIVKCVL